MTRKITILLAIILFSCLPVLALHSYLQSSTLPFDFNLLILGLDPRDDSLEKTQVTDTIIFSHFNSAQTKINIFSLPRDLWSYSLNTKINQIYPLSINQLDRFNFIQSNFSQITGQNIDRTLIVTTQNLIDLVDLVGGVDLFLDQGFEDDKYPNPEYIKNPSPQIPIYKTIKFTSGWIHLDSSNVTEFVRSRKSAETAASGGTDLGRIRRQRLLIDALLNQFKSTRNIGQLISLYNYYQHNIITNFTKKDLVCLFIKNFSHLNSLFLNKFEIPIGENPKTDILYHPKSFINSQWVFIPQDQQYQSLHQFIKKTLVL